MHPTPKVLVKYQCMCCMVVGVWAGCRGGGGGGGGGEGGGEGGGGGRRGGGWLECLDATDC